MSMKWMRCPNHNPQHATGTGTGEKLSVSPTRPSEIRLGLHPHDRWPQWGVLKHCIYVQQRPGMSMK
jgi:hypothetical protein